MVGTNVWDSKRIDALVESAQKLNDRLVKVANEYMVSDIWDNDDPDYAALRDNMIASLNKEVKKELEAATKDKTRYTDLVKIAGCYQAEHLNTKAMINEMDSHKRPDVERIIVHDGVFHADDVMCVAMAKTLNPDVEVVRTRDLDEKDIAMNGNGTYIADVGKGKYDHHQTDAAVRDDGNKYAACGLLYNEWKDKLYPDNPETQKYFEEVFIKPIEQADNGIAPNSLTTAIGSAVPTWRESDKSMDEEFNRMVGFCEQIISNAKEKKLTLEHEDMQHLHDKNEKYQEIATRCTEGKMSFEPIDWSDRKKAHFTPDYTMDMVEDAVSCEKTDLFSKSLEVLSSPIVVPYILYDPESINGWCDQIESTLTDPEYEAPSGKHADEIDWATYFTSRAMENSLSIVAARDHVMEAYANSKNKEIINLPQYMPWIEQLAKPELDAKFVTFPSIGGDVKLQCVPPSPDSFDKKVPLPEEWLTEKPEGCGFVHRERFIAGFDTVEHAVKAAELALEKEKTKGIYMMPKEEADILFKSSNTITIKNGEPAMFLDPKTKTLTLTNPEQPKKVDFRKMLNQMEKESHKPVTKSAPTKTKGKDMEPGD